MEKISSDIENLLCNEGFTSDCAVIASEVKSAESRLKRDKGDADNMLSYDHLICACDDLFVHIPFLLTGLVTHGFIHDFFL
jgi:hypothetical protein